MMKTGNILIAVCISIFILFGCADSDSSSRSEDKAITSFTFTASANSALKEDISGVIDEENKTIIATISSDTNVTALIATYTTTGDSVTVDGTTQTSGSTENNFINPKTYQVVAENGATTDYTVTARIPGATWSFVDGNGTNGINKDTARGINTPQLTEFSSKLYSIWAETNGVAKQIRIAEWDGASTWSFVDGNGTNGINKDANEIADRPQLTVFNSKLYATWFENYKSGDVGTNQIRVAEWDGTSTWNFVDGNGATGINKDTNQEAYDPQLTVYNSKLYAIWYESNGTNDQIRITEWDGGSTWNFVDGNGANGINKDTGQNARRPQLTVFNSKLYAIWYESNGIGDQTRIAEWDGNSTWRFVDGNGTNGINWKPWEDASDPQLTVFNSKLYAIWIEDSNEDRVRVAEWNGASTWSFIDGNDAYGINPRNTQDDADEAQLTVFNSRLYAIWDQDTGDRNHIRVAEWDGSSTWNLIDGGGEFGGIDKVLSEESYTPQLTVFNSKLYAIWNEHSGQNNSAQVRIAEGSVE